MTIYNILLLILLYTVAQGLTWLQMNLQFHYTWLQDKHWLLALFSLPIGYIFIKATTLCYNSFGNVWTGRLLGFSIGIVVFGILTELVFKEKLTTNTILSIILAIGIMVLQLKK